MRPWHFHDDIIECSATTNFADFIDVTVMEDYMYKA